MDKLLKHKEDTAKTINSFFKQTSSSSNKDSTEKTNSKDTSTSISETEINSLLQEFLIKIKSTDPENTWLKGFQVRYDSEWLLRFLIVDKYRIESAFSRYQSYYTTIIKLQKLSSIINGDFSWLIELWKHINETKVFAFYGFDAKNRAVLGLQCKNLDPQLITQIHGVVYDCLAFFDYFYSTFQQTKKNGIVWVVDTEGFNYDHFKLVAFNREFQKLHAKLWCGTVPLTISKVWVCNESKLINSAWSIFKPLLTKKLVDRVQMVGKQTSVIVDDLGGVNFSPTFLNGGSKQPEKDLDTGTLLLHLLNALPKQLEDNNNNLK